VRAAGTVSYLPQVDAAAAEALLAAEQLIADQHYADADAALDDLAFSVETEPRLALRALFAHSWARMYLGRLQPAVAQLEQARALADSSPDFSDLDRAECLFRLGCCRLKLSEVTNAVSLFTVALDLCDRSTLGCDRLRARALEWRSRCYQRQRDFDAARTDAERSLELAVGVGDSQRAADAYFQASLVAERTGQWLLARFYGEEARSLYDEAVDRVSVARLLNNLGGIDFLLGNVDQAVAQLKQSISLSLEAGSDADAAQAINSLAQIHLRTGDAPLAEEQARHALRMLEGRLDFVAETANAELVLGRALVAQSRFEEAAEAFSAAEDSCVRLDSVSQRAAVWVAMGDLAAARKDPTAAAEQYRRAAESLQDFHF
jgi:tetratricopeptide (TPR) repeat protein